MDLGLKQGTALRLAEELQQGWRYNKATTKARERAAAAEATLLRGNLKKGLLLRPVTVLDQQQAFEIEAKYGPDALFDRGFHRDMHRHCPETKVSDV